MTWTELTSRANILRNVPFFQGDRRLKPETTASLMLLRVAYERREQELRDFMADVAKRLKPEGYDQRAAAVSKMRDIESRRDGDGEQPTEEELSEAAETRKSVLPQYEREKEDFEKAFEEAARKKTREEVTVDARPLTRAEYADICALVGVEGDVELRVQGNPEPLKVPAAQLLAWVANLVEG